MAAEAPVAAQVQSFWNPALSDTTYYSVVVSPLPVPPMVIYGSYARQLKAQSIRDHFSFKTSELEGRELAEPGIGDLHGRVRRSTGTWSDAVLLQGSILGCSTWGSGINLDDVKPFALQPLETYIFTISGQVNVSNATADLTLQNVVSAEVEVVLGDLTTNFYGGTGFSSRRDRAIVVDFTDSLDCSDPAVGSLLFHIRRNIVEASSENLECRQGPRTMQLRGLKVRSSLSQARARHRVNGRLVHGGWQRAIAEEAQDRGD
eukprot:s7882_g3.t1